MSSPKTAPASRAIFAALALALALIAAFMPVGWYEALPRGADIPPRLIEGSTLLRLTFAVEALVTGALAVSGWRLSPAEPAEDRNGTYTAPRDDLTPKQALVLLALVVLLGIFLRFLRLGQDLWLDEIATVATYAAHPILTILAAYQSPGNHLLNSLLVRISTSALGESEVSARLPAVLFGIATIPTMYWTARLAMSRAASLGAALLLAVSYHHIWFSQNARGYSAHLFLLLLATGLLVTNLRRGTALSWVAYVFSMALCFAALMTTAFAFAAHVAVAAVVVIIRYRSGKSVRPLVERLVLAFTAIGILAFQIYAVSIPDVLAIYPIVYGVQGSGYALFSREFVGEMIRGVSAGFAVGIIALPFVAGGLAGFIILARRNGVLATSLGTTIAVTVLYLLLRGQSIAPRMLLPGLLLAILSCMATVDALVNSRRLQLMSRVPARAVTLAASGALALASISTLPSYYSAPKQPYRQAIAFLEQTQPEHSTVVVMYPASGGFRYYLAREQVDTAAYRYVATMSEYNSAVRSDQRQIVVTSLFRALRSTVPSLAARIESDWTPVRTFRGTLGDGDITVWRRRTGSGVESQ